MTFIILIFKDAFHLGGSSFAQSIAAVEQTPGITDPLTLKNIQCTPALSIVTASLPDRYWIRRIDNDPSRNVLSFCWYWNEFRFIRLGGTDTIRCLFSEK